MASAAACGHLLPLATALALASQQRRRAPVHTSSARPLKPFARQPVTCEFSTGLQALYRQLGDDPGSVLRWHCAGGGFVHAHVEVTQIPDLGWALSARAGIEADTVLVTTPAKLLWVARESEASEVEPLAPGEELPGASMLLRRRLVDALTDPSPFVRAMRPPGSIPLQLVAGHVAAEAPDAATCTLQGTSLLPHTLSLRGKLLEAAPGPELIGFMSR